MLRLHIDFGEADDLFAILSQRDALSKQAPCIVGKNIPRIQPMRGETTFQSLFSTDKYWLGHIRIVAAIEDMVGRGDSQEGIKDFVGGCSGKVVIEA